MPSKYIRTSNGIYLSFEQKLEIVRLTQAGDSTKDIAAKFGIRPTRVSDIRRDIDRAQRMHLHRSKGLEEIEFLLSKDPCLTHAEIAECLEMCRFRVGYLMSRNGWSRNKWGGGKWIKTESVYVSQEDTKIAKGVGARGLPLETKNEILALYKSGVRVVEIVKIIGCCDVTIYSILKRAGEKTRSQYKSRSERKRIIDQIIAEDPGVNTREILRKLGLSSESQLAQSMKKLGYRRGWVKVK